MITKDNLFKTAKTIKVDSLPASLKEGFEFVREVTENFTTWKYYKSDGDIKAAVDQYIAELAAHLAQPSGKGSGTARTSQPDQKAAREIAKDFIRPYVLRGETMQQLSKSHLGSANAKFHADISNNKIHISKIGNVAVQFTFPLKDIYEEILQKQPPAKKTTKQPVKSSARQQQLARQLARRLLKPFVLRGDTLKSYGTGKLSGSVTRNSVQVDGDTVNVTVLRGKKVDFIFSLKQLYNEIKDEAPKIAVKKRQNDKASPVERVDEAVRFIKRFVLLDGKTKTADQVRSFINSLQRAIVEKRIRKTSPYAKHIDFIQTALIGMYDNMDATIKIVLSGNVRGNIFTQLQEIAGSEKVRLSVSYMKRYIALQGKGIDKEKAKRLYNLIATAMNAGKIIGTDPYMKTIQRILQSLRSFVTSARKNDSLVIHDAVLNGINEALDGCACGCGKCDSLEGCSCQQLNGPEDRPTIMNSMDFAKLKFETLGFQGKWLDLIGDPSRNFTAMVFGKPKLGKSWLCLDFAGYLARNHGKVLYVAKEEGLDLTLQEKIESVKHPNLTVAENIPYDLLDQFDFIFLDSVSRLGLTPDDLNKLRADHPSKSFIFIFQTTKAGAFRGANTFQHDVDVVIEVPEKGKAVQMGRFNQGGKINIFED
ncbi:MAG: hypothetical protein J0H92_21025, partial [Sphingobacteriales bacterium]|nr:hypothetical protein [Sphingobacteriales bacterium]